MKKLIFSLLLVSISASAFAQNSIKLKYNKSVAVSIPEPSDICVDSLSGRIFVVSDKGGYAEIDQQGNTIQFTQAGLSDCEAVTIDNGTLLVVEERNRMIHQIEIEGGKEKKVIEIPYSGGRNKGYESICKLNNGQYLLITEKEPVWIFVLNQDFQMVNRIRPKVKRDISAATWHKGRLWLLSDEEASVHLMSADFITIEKSFRLNVNNPEGLAFLKTGEMLILSDDYARLYFFGNPLSE
jgi:uncharacterized protein YjiK